MKGFASKAHLSLIQPIIPHLVSQKTEAPCPPVALEVGALYRAYGTRVARWVGRLAPELDREELVQEIFLCAHQRLPSFRGEARVSTWLYGITQNLVRNRRRKEWVRQLWSRVSATTAPRLSTSPLEELERREAARNLYRALDKLPEKDRNTFILFEIEGLPGVEVAELTGQSVAAVRVRLSRARARVGGELERLVAKEMRGNDL